MGYVGRLGLALNEHPFAGDALRPRSSLPSRKTFLPKKKKTKPKTTTTTTTTMPTTMRRARNFVLGVGGTMTLLTLLGGFFPSSPALDATTSWLATNWVFVHGAYGIVAIALLLSSPKPKSC